MAVLTLALLAACAAPVNPAHRYAAALAEPDYARAFALCDGVGAMELDCQVAAIDRFGRYEDCARLDDRDECHFLHAEHLARAQGDILAGVIECKNAGRFAVECDEHLVGILAMGGDTIEEAARNFESVEADLILKSARAHFFRGWFHERYRRGFSPDPELCPDPECRRAGRHEAQIADRLKDAHQPR